MYSVVVSPSFVDFVPGFSEEKIVAPSGSRTFFTSLSAAVAFAYFDENSAVK